ncbi:MAG: HD domain-containing protein [bacterium]|nr:HD domain-containing protein [bacterium]
MITFFEKLKELVREQFPKEYACHVLFVYEIAMDLQKKYGGDLEVIELASIAHDIGRVEDSDNSLHPEIGSKKIIIWLREFEYNEDKIPHIARCILMHNKTEGFQSIEEKIVCSADNLSKLLYLDIFMLMCKKDTYLEKAKWGLKYIEKGYAKLVLPELREEYKPLYESLKKRYESILNQ